MVGKKCTKIFFRVFPAENMNWDFLKILEDQRTIYVRYLQELTKFKQNVLPTFWTFRSDHVYFNETQKEVYDGVVSDVFENILHGSDAIIMAYGQTGTGKSLTIGGLQKPFEDRGILPRLVSDAFERLLPECTKNKTKLCIQVSYLEFSRNGINNLLIPYPNVVHNLKEVTKTKVNNIAEALKIIFKGEGRKVFAENAQYASHVFGSVFTFYFNTKRMDMQENAVSKCKLHVIDLAGSDTVGNFPCLFKSPHEIGSANLTKTQLEQFFLVLISQIPEHIRIKQRLNPMIQYLSDSLNKEVVLRLVGHIRTSPEDLLITLSMLRFAELIGGLKTTRHKATTDKEITLERILQLENELAQLTLQNKYNGILLQQDLSKSLNEDRAAHIERTVNEYLQNKITHLTLVNVCDVNTALDILKVMYKKCEEEKNQQTNVIPVSKPKRLSASSVNQKVSSKSSRGSHKTASTETLTTKRSTSAAAKLKSSSDRVPSLHRPSVTRSKTSNASISKKSSNEKRKSLSNTSRDKFKSEELMPKMPPEYKEAWTAYTNDQNEEFINSVKLYQKNEAEAKAAYKTYLNELNKLNCVSAKVEKFRNDLLMAKMTRQFQQANKYNETGEICFTDFEKCVMAEFEKAQLEQFTQQEVVLKCQTELKVHIEACKTIKQQIEKSFELFCRENYQMALPRFDVAEAAKWDIENTLKAEDENVENTIDPENVEMKQYERLQYLIEHEKAKKRLYLVKNREWLTH